MRSYTVSALIAAAISVAFLAQEPSRLITASNVRLRSLPAEAADIVASVPLGTALVQLESGGEGGAWVRLRLADGRDGWTPSRLARRFTPETKIDVFETLIKERLGRSGDSFPARAELVAFIDRVRSDIVEPEARGRFALHWLNAMTAALRAVPIAQAKNAPYAAWLEARKSIVVYNQPGGVWMLRPDAILALHDREKDTSSADDIAWFRVSNGLPGECEGFLPCYLRASNLLRGEYLRRHPAGRHVDEALSIFPQLAAGMVGATMARPGDCRELLESLTPLRAAVTATRATGRQPALDALERVSVGCGK